MPIPRVVRLLALLFLALPLLADDPSLVEPRAWRGWIEARATTPTPPRGEGCEDQTERIDFVLATEPPRTSVGTPHLPFAMRDSRGSWRLKIDLKELGDALEDTVSTKGSGAGELHSVVGGWVEPASGHFHFGLKSEPEVVTARTLLSGIEKGQFRTLRTVMARRAVLSSFSAEGVLEAGGAAASGSSSFEERSSRLMRVVTITWGLQRVDPEIRGRVVDHAGRPLAGVKILARTNLPERVRSRLPPLLREGVTDADGGFRIGAFPAHWQVQFVAEERGGLLVAGSSLPEGALLRFEEVPEIKVTLQVYRLAELPAPEKLWSAFAGDVAAYLAWLGERTPAARLEAARLP